MDKHEIQEKIKQLEERRETKRQNIKQAEKIIDAQRVEIVGINGALREFNAMLDEQLIKDE